MRTRICVPFIAVCLVLAACDGEHRTEQSFAAEKAPSAKAGDLQAQILRYKQRDTALIATLRLVNTGKEAITLKNPGTTMTGFTAGAEGRTTTAEKPDRAKWSPWTGSVAGTGQNRDLIELPAGEATEIELRWSWGPPLQRHDYPWTITIGQAYKGAARLPDLRLSYPAK